MSDLRPRLRLVRDIERRSASRLLGTERAPLAEDEPTGAATLLRRIGERGL